MGKYSDELSNKVIKLHLQEGRSQGSLEREYSIGRGTVSNWIKTYNKECQENVSMNEQKEGYGEYLKLKNENEELKKENLFLKKAAEVEAKGNIEKYEFIKKNAYLFGLRWLLKRLNLSPNGYYNHLKNRKMKCLRNKQSVLLKIQEIFHRNNGVPGYRMITHELRNCNVSRSCNTVCKYMK